MRVAAGEGVSAIKHSTAPSGRGREGERGREGGMRDDVCLLKRLTTADKKLGAHPSIRPSVHRVACAHAFQLFLTALKKTNSCTR